MDNKIIKIKSKQVEKEIKDTLEGISIEQCLEEAIMDIVERQVKGVKIKVYINKSFLNYSIDNISGRVKIPEHLTKGE